MRGVLSAPEEETLVEDPEQDLGLKETSVSVECKSCMVIDESSKVLEMKNELQRCPAALAQVMSVLSKIPISHHLY